MSAINSATSRVSYIDTVNPNRYDNIDEYANLASFPATGFIDKIYLALDTGISYRWNGSTYVTYIASSADVITSASNVGTGLGKVYKQEVANNLEFRSVQGTVNQITVTNNTNDVTLSTPQDIAPTSNVTFNRIISTLNPASGQHVATKNYVDTSCVQSITSQDPNVLTVGGTLPNITLDPQMGFGDAGLYTLANSANSAGNIRTDSNGDFTSVTEISLNVQALNRYDANYVKYLLTSQQHAVFRLGILNNALSTEYACFIIRSLISVGANSVTFEAENDVSMSTVSTFPNGTTLKVFFHDHDRNFSSNNQYIANIDYTDKANPIIQPLVGADHPINLLYEFGPVGDTGSANANFFITNYSARNSFNVGLTFIEIGISPQNVSATWLKRKLELLAVSGLPASVRVVNTSDDTEYATFNLTANGGSFSNSWRFTATYDASNSSVITFTKAVDTLHVVIIKTETQTLSNKTLGTDLNANNYKITSLANPTLAGDATNKSYVDAVASGLSVKNSVRVATIGPLTLASDFENGDTVDTVVLATNDRILIKNQASGVENGIYIVNASGAPTRASDYSATSAVGGTFMFVEEGTQQDSGWVCTNDSGTDVVGTDALTFSQFSGAGQITAGDGLDKTGNTLSVDLKANGGLVIETAELAVDLGASNITGILSVADGGTGQTTYSDGQLLIGNTITTGLSKATLTEGTGISITNGTGSITISASGLGANTTGYYLNGSVVITSTPTITLDGTPQTGHPFSISGSTITVIGDLTINGSLTMNTGGTNLVVEGDLTILGTFTGNASSTIGVKGNFHCRGRSSADAFLSSGCSIVSYDEFSVNNYSNTVPVRFLTGTTNSVNARSIVFDTNTTGIQFEATGTHSLTADIIQFTNNNSDGTWSADDHTIHIYNTTIKSAIARFIGNTSTNRYCIIFHGSQLVSTDLLDIEDNECNTGTQGLTVYNTNGTITADKITIKNNRNLQNGGANDCVHNGNFGGAGIINCNILELINNYTLNSGAKAFNNISTCKVQCETIQMNLSDHNGTTNNQNITIGTSTDVSSQFSTGRLPVLLMYNPNSATISNFPTSTYLGVMPYGQYNSQVVSNITLTTIFVEYLLLPSSGSFNTNTELLPISAQFDSPSAGRIRYIGSDTCDVELKCSVNMYINVANRALKVKFYKNGAPIAPFTDHYFYSAGIAEGMNLATYSTATTNDYFEIYISDITLGGSIGSCNSMSFSVQKKTIM